MRHPVGRAVRALDEGGGTAPDGAGALGAPEQVLLVVGGAEDVVARQAQQQHGRGVWPGQVHRMVHQVQTLHDITRWGQVREETFFDGVRSYHK